MAASEILPAGPAPSFKDLTLSDLLHVIAARLPIVNGLQELQTEFRHRDPGLKRQHAARAP
jgi:hypothetical protein